MENEQIIKKCKTEGCENEVLPKRRLCKECRNSQCRVYYLENKEKFRKYYIPTGIKRGRPKKQNI